MKKGATLFLKGIIILLGMAVLAIAIFVLPVGISTDQTGWYRPILIAMYLPAIPFFIALFEGYRLLNYIEENKVFSGLSVKSLTNIKRSAIAISLLFAVGLPYIFYVGDKDDAPGAIAIAFIIVFVSLVIGVFAGVLQNLFQKAIDIKAENDLTV